RLTERRGRINHLPRTLLPHHTEADSGEKEFLPGKIAETVSSGIERQRQLVAQRMEKTERPAHTKARTEIPTHEETTRQLPQADNHDHQLSIAQDPTRASKEELIQNPAVQELNPPHPKPTVDPPITIESVDPLITIQSVELSTTADRSVDESQPFKSENQPQ